MQVAEDLIFDLGMHLGQDTCYYLKKGYRVVSFEADPALVENASERFRQELESGQLRMVSGAVAPPSQGESVTLYLNDTSVWNSINGQWAEKRGSVKTIVVPRVDFVDSLATYGTPQFMKVDLEGTDCYILEVMRSQRATPPMLSVETEKENWSVLIRQLKLLSEIGYSRFRIVQQAWVTRCPSQILDRNGRQLTFHFERDGSGPFGDDLHQPWRSLSEIQEEYQGIFRDYRRWGDNSAIHRSRPGRRLASVAGRLIGRPLPGWHDLHCAI